MSQHDVSSQSRHVMDGRVGSELDKNNRHLERSLEGKQIGTSGNINQTVNYLLETEL